jgi:hypothetical protein
MAPQKRPKLAVADTTGELLFIEQFGRPLGIQDIPSLRALQYADRHYIVVTPSKRCIGKFEARLNGAAELLLVSRQPLLDVARVLLGARCKPGATIALRRAMTSGDDMRSSIEVAAKLTVDESKGTVLVGWKPFSRSAASTLNRARRMAAINLAPRVKSHGQRDRRAKTVNSKESIRERQAHD